MKPIKARKLADQTQPAVLTIRRTIEILKGETDPLLIICHDNLTNAIDLVKQTVNALNNYTGD